jgi:gamma-glutamyl:cysteine ligase YbdK (ATP-grasp superfamily)
MPALAVVATTLSPGRPELAAATAGLAEAEAALAEANARHGRLSVPAAALAEAKTELAALTRALDAERLAWIDAGCRGERPALPPGISELEGRVAELARDVGAAEGGLPAAQAAVEAAGAQQWRRTPAARRGVVERHPRGL